MGVPTPMLRWYRDGKQLVPGASLKIKANSKESKSFLGIFACEAENCMGTKAIFSKVYARHFGQYLKQFREKLPSEESKKTITLNTNTPITSAQKDDSKKTSLNSDNSSHHSLTDSGIAVNASNNSFSNGNAVSLSK
jgi:hypothetical protein